MEKAIIERMLSFAEENWSDFLEHCGEGGFDESEIEKAFDALKEKYLG